MTEVQWPDTWVATDVMRSPKLGSGLVTLYWRGPAKPNTWSAHVAMAGRTSKMGMSGCG